ncbi:MAG: hypothetical protein GDA55_01140 [Cellvibrionales bacterium]|nr:hypothetical protein [Cellvibrionales bacterium]
MNIAFVAKRDISLSCIYLAEGGEHADDVRRRLRGAGIDLDAKDLCATEAWEIGQKTRAELEGGRVSLHCKRKAKSWVAGEILAVYETDASKRSKSGKERFGILFKVDSFDGCSGVNGCDGCGGPRGEPAVDGTGLRWAHMKAVYK